MPMATITNKNLMRISTCYSLCLFLLVFLWTPPSTDALINDDSDLVFDDVDNHFNHLNGKSGASAAVSAISPVETPQLQDDKRALGRQQQQLDLSNDEDYDFDGSGNGSGNGVSFREEPESTPTVRASTVVPTLPPSTNATPLLPSPISPETGVPVFYRMTLNLTNLQYQAPMSDRNSDIFSKLAQDLESALEPLYDTMPGQQAATVIKLDDTPPGVRATVDLGSLNFNDPHALERVIKDELERRRLGPHAVSPEGFTFRRVDGAPQDCSVDEFRCNNGDCIPFEKYCDNHIDCEDDGADELDCDPQCEPGQFTCDRLCLPDSVKCDGAYDCIDGRDEENCPSQPVTPENTCPRQGMYQCKNGDCIEGHQRCDYDVQCADGEDETFCPPCASDQWRCRDDTCIPVQKRCDGSYDCPDYTDERECGHVQPAPACASHEWQCDDGQCIDRGRKCDQYVDCADRSDEQHCEQASLCSPSQFKCSDGTCIESHLHCDNRRDCPDGSDERDCPRCRADEFTCRDGTCVHENARCNERPDCPDRSDEENCEHCAPNTFQCISNKKCIDIRRRCDRRTDCEDGSDETNCGGEAGECGADLFRCSDGQCIAQNRKCDGHHDCSDGADEYDCACGPGQFQCQDRSCIPAQQECDGQWHCRDGSDEAHCVVRGCTSEQFQCTDGTCIDKQSRCNEYPECPDHSDERNCETCAQGYVSCNDGTCIDVRRRCDGRNDCRDGSDEHCVCLPGQFQCNDRTCIDPELQCDGKNDCYDGSDEENCVTTRCPSGQFECHVYGNCIDEHKKCDGRQDCLAGEDEENCPTPVQECRTDEFRCHDGKCIDARRHCDEYPDCDDYSDEQDCHATRCHPTQFQCNSGECVDGSAKCNRYQECRDGSDEANCPPPPTPTPVPGCSANEFTCRDGSCIDSSRRCDRYVDCPDYSDEQECEGTSSCPHDQFQCNNGECVAASAKCNGRHECRDGSDEIGCQQIFDRCHSGEFSCENGECVERSARCDGKQDCSDYSDEKDCPPRGNVNLKTYPDHQVIHQSREVVFQCRDEGAQRAPVGWSRQGGLSLPHGSLDVLGRLTMPNIQPEHSGTYFCTAKGYPPTQPGAQRSVYLQVNPYDPPTLPPSGPCKEGQSTCHNGQCIDAAYVCDNDFDCHDGSDEHNCARNLVCEPNEFRCNNSKCILKFWLCDGDNDCLDKSDETNCPTPAPGSECNYDEFQCRSRNQCIPKSFLCDGSMDCQDRSDEIGCSSPTIINLPPETITVSIGETVTLTCRAIGTPTPLINWRLNWGNVPPPPRVTTTNDNGRGVLTIQNVQPSDQGAYTCEAISHKETILGQPDTQLIVKTVSSVCQPPFFNAAARTTDECSRCFCFGVTDQCTSSNLHVSQLPPITESSVSAVTLGPDGTYNVQDPRYNINQDIVDFRPSNREFRLDNRVQQGNPRSVQYYWTMPIQLQGNKLTSYGGYLRYSVQYRISSSPSPTSSADVILKGNNMLLSYSASESIRPGTLNKIEARFWEGHWIRLSTPDRREPAGSASTASREDIMMVLQNIELFLVRAGYDENFAETSLIGLTMDTAVPQETGQPRATFVEQCTCPPGYTGSSCQECAPGYSRVATGRYLGECRRTICNCHGHSDSCSPQGLCERCQHNTEGPQCERCKPGFYGDGRRGTPSDCQPCPCPLTSPPNQFSSTCYLDRDGQVTCECPSGYEGRRCEKCAYGYQGNPSIPGDSCRRTPVDQCDPAGSTSLAPSPVTGLCPCKAFATGPRCNQCKPYTYHLNPQSSGGCINCFCMGVTRNCTSCSLYRSLEKVQFSNSPEGFTLTTAEKSETFERGLQASPSTNQLTYRDFYFQPRGQTFYWNAPAKFIGDKITSYGGFLNYTINYESDPGATANTDPDVQITGNRITLDYYHRQPFISGSPNTIAIPLFEHYWRRSDGQSATREHLLMALADLDSLLIKASYTTDIIESSISEVSLEIAQERDTGGKRADAVEQCRCPVGFKGLSCEDCDSGYTRSGGGLYLGLCEPCFCNGHSSDCDPESGECRNCQHDTEGDFCEICKPGFKGDSTIGTPYDCQAGEDQPCRCSIQGSLGVHCDSRRQCPCKNNVEGHNCNRCKEGTFNLEARNSEGCSRCFCFGITKQCTSSSYYRSEVALQVYDSRNHGVTLASKSGTALSGISVTGNADKNEVMIRSFPLTNEAAYWSLPEIFLGNKLTSYGGSLKFMQRYLSRRDADPYDDVDVIIKGNGASLHYVSRPPLQPDEGRHAEIELVESQWQQSDNYGVVPAERETFMMVLANVESIMIRATFNTRMIDSVLGEVILETAVPHSTGKDLAYTIEQCQCPPGYTGLSCEECAPGYNRDPRSGSFLGRCSICNCHGHSQECDANTGECTNCEHNTVGTSCQKCAQGFFGDATRGTADDCQLCPCPLTTSSNQFSQSCHLDSDGRPTCTACPTGYAGRNCERCAPGYTGNPRQPGDSCRIEGTPSLTVRIEEPKIVRTQAGSTVTFRCSGFSQVRDVSYNIVWTKEGGPLPSQAQERDGILTITSARQQDSGVYVCTISDLYSEAQDKATLLISRRPDQQYSAPQVWIEPTYLELQVGEPAEFHCQARGYPQPSLQWTGGQNDQLNPASSFHNGVFRIPAVSKSDDASYYCTATNAAGTETARTIIYVRGGDLPQPGGHHRVTIEPEYLIAQRRETVTFECKPSSDLYNPYISWSRLEGPLPSTASQAGHILTLPNVDASFQGTYVCSISSSSVQGVRQAQARLEISSGGAIHPSCSIEPEMQTVAQGTTVELKCTATGDPIPSIHWSKIGEEFGNQHQVIGSALRIVNIDIRDRGVYLCVAENSEGIAQSRTVLEVDRREPPGIELYPGTTKTIGRGESALFQCRITAGEPTPKLTWTRHDGRPLPHSVEIVNSGSVIRFNRVVGDEAGQYICTAENDAGSVTAIAALIIQGLPVIKISPASPYRVSQGERIHIECRAEGDPSASVSWKQPPARAGTEVGYGFPRETPGIAILEINQVSPRDAGQYTCVARNSAGSSQATFDLIVEGSSFARPPIETDHRSFVVPEGSQAELNCYSREQQPDGIRVSWVRSDGQPLPVGHIVRDGLLIIENVRKEDAGEYTCLGFINDVIVATAVEQLHVVAPPRITLSPLRQVAKPGDSIYVQCVAQGDQPIEVQWTRVGGVLGQNVYSSGGIIQFHSISVSDAGRYLCTATSAAGRAEGVAEVLVNEVTVAQEHCDPATQRCANTTCQDEPTQCIQVHLPDCTIEPCFEEPFVHIPNRDMNVYIGTTIELACEVRGLPRPTVMWHKEAGDLPVNSKMIDTNLRLNSVRIEDAGRYYCTATNDAGSSRDYVNLLVKGLSGPLASYDQEHCFQCSSGQCINFNLRCDGKVDCDTMEDELDCDDEDHHRYSRGLTPVTVHIRPSLDVVRIGDDLDVHCEVSGDPVALISWSRAAGSLSYNTQTAGNLLRINNVQPENGGIYRCKVDTHTGTFTDDYVLSIQDNIPSLPQHKVETRTAPFGSTISMDCRSTMHPPVEYKWTRQGGILPNDATIRGATLTIPDVRAEDAGTYVCTVRDAEDIIDIPTILLVTGVVPYFAQAPSSFMALPTLPDAYLTFDIELSFKPETSDGLIVYNGQQSDGGGDFISFGLSEGVAEFRFDLGSGPAIIRSRAPLEIAEWHTVHLHRNKKQGMMTIDSDPPINLTASGKHQGLDLLEPLYIGGVPDFSSINKQSGFEHGFVGCISRLIISKVPKQLVQDAQVTSGVTSCETCTVNPCSNGGLCQEAHTSNGHICICPPGFSGSVCERTGEACYPGVCGSGRCINRQGGEGFDCYCPFGRGGERCEKGITIHEPAFRDGSFISYPTPNARAQKQLKVATRFKPRNLKDGIILYCAQNSDGHGDFISLTIKDKHIELRFDTGSGPAVLQSKEELQADQWVQVTAERNVRDGKLTVNDGEAVRGKSPGFTRGLNLNLPLFVGGIDQHRVTLSPFVAVNESLNGCISHMEVGGVEIDLINSVKEAANVEDCGDQSPCDRQPCQNGGLCKELGTQPDDFECICQEGFQGKFCEIEDDVCKVIDPCVNGGICVGTGTGYRCSCLLGFTGDHCEKMAEFGDNARFQGDGYLELPRTMMPHSASTVSEMLTLYFKTNEANGVILWHGQKPDTDGKGQDYFSLSVVDGYLVFSFELGSGPSDIRSSLRVNDGNKHKVVIKRLGRDGRLELDDVFTAVGESQGILQMLNTEGNIYLGGLPRLEFMTASKYKHNFTGCIFDLEIEDADIVDLQHTALSGRNVVGCENDSDDFTLDLDNQIHQ